MTEQLTDLARRYLLDTCPLVGAEALRIIDQLTEALEAERAETADWLDVSRDWRVRADAAEARVRELERRVAAALRWAERKEWSHEMRAEQMKGALTSG